MKRSTCPLSNHLWHSLKIGLLICLSIFSTQAQVSTPTQGADTGGQDSLTVQKLPSIQDLMAKSAPRFLTLEKNGGIKRLRYYVGSKIEFDLKGDPNRYNAALEGIKDSLVIIYDTPVLLSSFEAVYVTPERPFVRLLSGFLIGAGLGYLALDTVNNSFSPNRESLIVSSSFVLPGAVLLFLLKKRRIHLNKNRYLKTIQAF